MLVERTFLSTTERFAMYTTSTKIAAGIIIAVLWVAPLALLPPPLFPKMKAPVSYQRRK